MKSTYFMPIGLMVALIIISPLLAHGIHESKEPVNTPKNNSTVQYPIITPKSEMDYQYQQQEDSSRLENPDEVQPQLGGPQGDPFCKVVRSFSNSPLGPALDQSDEGLDQFEKRCGDLDGENTEEDNLTMLESARDSKDTPTDLKNELSVGLEIIDCAEKESFGSLTSDEKDRCDPLILDAKNQCDIDSSISFCLHSGPNNFNPIEFYIERNNLGESEDSSSGDSEDNDSNGSGDNGDSEDSEEESSKGEEADSGPPADSEVNLFG